jgi:protein SCO1/2
VSLCVLGAAVVLATVLSDGAGKPHRTAFAGPLMPRNLPAADFTLADQRGRTVRLATTRGRVVVLTFLHSRCHSTCPVTVQTIRGALDDLGHARAGIDVLAVSVAPAEDTPASVRRFVAVQHAAGFLRYLRGTRAQLAPVWKAYAMQPQGPGGEDHSAFVFLVDRRGLLRVGWPSHQVTPELLAHDLRLLLAEHQ